MSTTEIVAILCGLAAAALIGWYLDDVVRAVKALFSGRRGL